MNLIVTDGHTLNPGDLSWDEIRTFGELTIYDRTTPDELLHRCKNADIIITNKTPIPGDTISQLPNLKLITVTATGYNIVDIKTASAQNISVANVPGYGTSSVAQHSFALILELSNRAGIHSTDVAAGNWQTAIDWCYTLTPITELADKIIGIVGMGNIGQQVAAIATVLGMNVLYHTPNPRSSFQGKSVDLNELFSTSDIVSLHCPQTPENTGFVNRNLLRKMKKSAWLINTSRGGLINEADLAEALTEKWIAAAALDVLSKEPPVANHPLIGLSNCLITPHIAWISFEARKRIITETARNIKSFLQGKPINVVN